MVNEKSDNDGINSVTGREKPTKVLLPVRRDASESKKYFLKKERGKWLKNDRDILEKPNILTFVKTSFFPESYISATLCYHALNIFSGKMARDKLKGVWSFMGC